MFSLDGYSLYVYWLYDTSEQLEGNRSLIGKSHGRQRALMPFHISDISPVQGVADGVIEKSRTYPLGKYGEPNVFPAVRRQTLRTCLRDYSSIFFYRCQ